MLLELSMTKVVAIKILCIINNDFGGRLFPPISVSAIKREEQLMSEAKKSQSRTTTLNNLLLCYVTRYRYTLVQHAVGFHKDFFQGVNRLYLKFEKC